MKVLLCSPYKSAPDIMRGGINQWAQNILSYHKEHTDEIEIIPVSLDRHISLIHSNNASRRFINGIRELVPSIREATKILKTAKPDVMHICTSAGMGCLRDILLVKEARKHHVRSIIHLHFGRLPELADRKNWEWYILKTLLLHCDVIVPMNKPTEKALFDNGFKNVRYLPNPLSEQIINQVTELEGHAQRKAGQILFVGHVYESKGVIELVKGLRDIDGVKLRVVGKCTNEFRETLLSLSDTRNHKDWIVFVGEINHKEVIKEFLEADLFVFPSYTEGFPNVILEAMACGCPIIASEVGAIPEMLNINNEPCGICIKPKSEQEVHDAVVSLLNDESQKERYSEAARRRVNSIYTIPNVWKELVNIWNL